MNEGPAIPNDMRGTWLHSVGRYGIAISLFVGVVASVVVGSIIPLFLGFGGAFVVNFGVLIEYIRRDEFGS